MGIPHNPCSDLANLETCATVNESNTEYPKIIVVDYGDGCEDAHGKTKTGSIEITMSDDLNNAGAIRTVKFVDFYMNDRKVEGFRVVKNTGINQSGQIVFEMSGSVNKNHKGEASTHTYSKTKTWISGSETCEKDDDEFIENGTSSQNGKRSHSAEFTNVHIAAISCEYPLSGTITKTGDKGTYVIDFGEETCDQYATITNEYGNSKEIDLSERKGKSHKGNKGRH